MQRAILLTKMIAWMVVAGVLGGASFGQEYWKRQLPSDINMQFILPTSEGKFLLWGETDTTNILLKIEPNGNTLWMKTYGADIHSNVRWIQSLPDGTVFLTGNNLSAGEGNGDLWMCKLDSNGDSLWIKTMEVRQFQDFIISQPTPDGNFLFASDINDVLRLMEINENGDSLWMKTYERTDDKGQLFEVKAIDNGCFLLGGCKYIVENGWDSAEGWLQKIHASGDTLWTKTYKGGSGWNDIESIIPTKSGNCLLYGSVSSDDWFLMVNQNGDSLWSKTCSAKVINQIQPTNNGDFLIAGTNQKGVFLWRIDRNGDALWEKHYGGLNGIVLTSIAPTPEGDFLFAVLNRDSGGFLTYIVDDRSAFDDSLFTFKIPCLDVDSLDYEFSPIDIPAGMSVSPGGTISWRPATDLVYMEQVKYLIVNDSGGHDTLCFSIFVNSDHPPAGTVKPATVSMNHPIPIDFSISVLPKKVKFTLPPSVSLVALYDITGRQLGRIKPTVSGSVAIAHWVKQVPIGRYFVKAFIGRTCITKTFLVMK
jgi:hypothetical protein